MNFPKFSILALLVACQTTTPNNKLLTDETKSSLSLLCKDLDSEGITEDLQRDFCGCVENLPVEALAKDLRQACADGSLVGAFSALNTRLSIEGDLVLTDTPGHMPSPADLGCKKMLIELYEEIVWDDFVRSCKTSDTQKLKNIAVLTKQTKRTCWGLTHMSDDGCFVATPCRGSGGSNLADLPVTPRLGGIIPENTTVEICNANIQAIHKLKDPAGENRAYNYAFANMIGFGRTSKAITYGAANCHGTAQAVIGGILDDLPVTQTMYHSEDVRSRCGDPADRAFKTAKTGDGFAQASVLPIGKGGHIINMNHDSTCSENDCGKVSFNTFDCNGQDLESNLFYEDMCINCWDKLLLKQGFTRLTAESTWLDLKPGAILTQADHTIVFLYENSGLCYYYESTTPYGAAQLRVNLCPQVFNHFDRKWNPQAELVFNMTHGS